MSSCLITMSVHLLLGSLATATTTTNAVDLDTDMAEFTDTDTDILMDYEEGEGRLGFISIGSNGATSLAFNATSIQGASQSLLVPSVNIFKKCAKKRNLW